MSTNDFKVTLIPTTTTIHQLPDLALLQMLHHVPTGGLVHVARLVCQRWNSLYREVLATRKQRLILIIGSPAEGLAPAFFYDDCQFFETNNQNPQNPREARIRLDSFPLKKTQLTKIASFFPRISSLTLVNALGPATILTLSVFADMIEAVLEAKLEFSSKFSLGLENGKLTHLKVMLGGGFDPGHWHNSDPDWYQTAISTQVPPSPECFDAHRVFAQRGQALFKLISSPRVCPALHHLEIWYEGALWNHEACLQGVNSRQLLTFATLRQILYRGQALRELHLQTGDLSADRIVLEFDRDPSKSRNLKLYIHAPITKVRTLQALAELPETDEIVQAHLNFIVPRDQANNNQLATLTLAGPLIEELIMVGETESENPNGSSSTFYQLPIHDNRFARSLTELWVNLLDANSWTPSVTVFDLARTFLAPLVSLEKLVLTLPISRCLQPMSAARTKDSESSDSSSESDSDSKSSESSEEFLESFELENSLIFIPQVRTLWMALVMDDDALKRNDHPLLYDSFRGQRKKPQAWSRFFGLFPGLRELRLHSVSCSACLNAGSALVRRWWTASERLRAQWMNKYIDSIENRQQKPYPTPLRSLFARTLIRNHNPNNQTTQTQRQLEAARRCDQSLVQGFRSHIDRHHHIYSSGGGGQTSSSGSVEVFSAPRQLQLAENPAQNQNDLDSNQNPLNIEAIFRRSRASAIRRDRRAEQQQQQRQRREMDLLRRSNVRTELGEGTSSDYMHHRNSNNNNKRPLTDSEDSESSDSSSESSESSSSSDSSLSSLSP